MNRNLKVVLLEAGVIGGMMLAFICIAEGARDKLKRELAAESDKLWTEAAKADGVPGHVS